MKCTSMMSPAATLDPRTGAVVPFNVAVQERALMEATGTTLLIAAISHPANYVVRVTPDLTPREERRAKQGHPRPIQKTPHFIVVDHEVLTALNPNRRSSEAGHASPVPHYRRGHWMKLAERCRHARLLGKNRVLVRDTFVGDANFRGDKNFYEVLLDFGK